MWLTPPGVASPQRATACRVRAAGCGCWRRARRCPRRCCRARATARTVASRPKRRRIGCAQWWPERTAMPSWSSAAPTSSVRKPSSTNDSTPAFSAAVPISAQARDRAQRARSRRRAARARSARCSSMPIALHVVERRAEARPRRRCCRCPPRSAPARGWYTVFSNVTSSIMLPPPCHGGIASSTLALAVERADAGRRRTPCGRRTRRSRSRAPARRPRMCETACAPSTSTRAPWRCAIAIISRAGVIGAERVRDLRERRRGACAGRAASRTPRG